MADAERVLGLLGAFRGFAADDGSLVPDGLAIISRDRAVFETDQIPMPNGLRFLEDWINYGEAYSKMPRMIPYTILPIGAALMLFRIVQAVGRVWTGAIQLDRQP